MEKHFDAGRRHDFVFLFDVQDGNPNGDPDAGNLPRMDPETMQGLVTDVCLKRKVRNFVAAEAGGNERNKIYVEHHGVLNALHRRAYVANDIPLGTRVDDPLQKEYMPIIEDSGFSWPDGFWVEESDDENDDGSAISNLFYSGELDKEGLNEALNSIKGEAGEVIANFARRLARQSGKAPKPSRENVEKARRWMCENFFDVRTFGAVMSTSINCGQVRGPMQLTFSRSIDPINPLDVSLTRVAITKEEDANKKVTEMGRKAFVPYGLYKGYGFFNPRLATDTGFNGNDLKLFWQAFQKMWDLDRSASRGLMSLRKLIVFTHDSDLGNAPAHVLFERVHAKLKEGVTAPRSFSDYDVQVDSDDLPNGVSILEV